MLHTYIILLTENIVASYISLLRAIGVCPWVILMLLQLYHMHYCFPPYLRDLLGPFFPFSIHGEVYKTAYRETIPKTAKLTTRGNSQVLALHVQFLAFSLQL
jgi:hypothetical protein